MKNRPKSKAIELTCMRKNGRPRVKFDSGDSDRLMYIAILDRPKNSPLRRRLVAEVEDQATRAYVRYRKKDNPIFRLEDDEARYMQKFGILCVRKGVSPAKVIKHWSENIGSFANRKMRVIPSSFLSSSANVDAVACLSVEDSEPAKRREACRPAKNSFSNVSSLDHRLRGALDSAGFDVGAYTDRHLLTYQVAALGIARGHDMYISKKMKPIVDWLVHNFFVDVEKDEDLGFEIE